MDRNNVLVSLEHQYRKRCIRPSFEREIKTLEQRIQLQAGSKELVESYKSYIDILKDIMPTTKTLFGQIGDIATDLDISLNEDPFRANRFLSALSKEEPSQLKEIIFAKSVKEIEEGIFHTTETYDIRALLDVLPTNEDEWKMFYFIYLKLLFAELRLIELAYGPPGERDEEEEEEQEEEEQKKVDDNVYALKSLEYMKLTMQEYNFLYAVCPSTFLSISKTAAVNSDLTPRWPLIKELDIQFFSVGDHYPDDPKNPNNILVLATTIKC